MKVQRHTYWQAGRGALAQAAQQLALGVRVAIDHHGAMQIQQHRITALRGAGDHPASHRCSKASRVTTPLGTALA